MLQKYKANKITVLRCGGGISSEELQTAKRAFFKEKYLEKLKEKVEKFTNE